MKLANPEIRPWWKLRNGDIESYPEEDDPDAPNRAPDGWGLYVDGDDDTPQVHIADGARDHLQALAKLIRDTNDTADIVLDGEPCPENCIEDCEDPACHDMSNDAACDLLRFVVDVARENVLPRAEEPYREPTAYPAHLTGDRF